MTHAPNPIDRSTPPDLIARFLRELAPALAAATGTPLPAPGKLPTRAAGMVLRVSPYTFRRYLVDGAPGWMRLAMLAWITYHAPVAGKVRSEWIALLTVADESIFALYDGDAETVGNTRAKRNKKRNVRKSAGSADRRSRKSLRSNKAAANTPCGSVSSCPENSQTELLTQCDTNTEGARGDDADPLDVRLADSGHAKPR